VITSKGFARVGVRVAVFGARRRVEDLEVELARAQALLAQVGGLDEMPRAQRRLQAEQQLVSVTFREEQTARARIAAAGQELAWLDAQLVERPATRNSCRKPASTPTPTRWRARWRGGPSAPAGGALSAIAKLRSSARSTLTRPVPEVPPDRRPPPGGTINYASTSSIGAPVAARSTDSQPFFAAALVS